MAPRIPTIQAQIDRYLEDWRSPLPITLWSCGPKSDTKTTEDADLDRFHATVAQYTLNSMAALKEKLGQFPRGTRFQLSRPFDNATPACLDDLRAFLTSHEFSVTDAKTEDGS